MADPTDGARLVRRPRARPDPARLHDAGGRRPGVHPSPAGLIPDRRPMSPVVMVTADTESDVRHRALSLGAQDFLTKPVDKVELTARVTQPAGAAQEPASNSPIAPPGWPRKWRKATAEIAAREKEAILRLSRAAEYRDPETGSHLLRMSNYTRLIAAAARPAAAGAATAAGSLADARHRQGRDAGPYPAQARAADARRIRRS
jgi:CheY-like chemotaxis protein